MNMVENLYNENKDISSDKIQELLILVSNERKEKQKILRK